MIALKTQDPSLLRAGGWLQPNFWRNATGGRDIDRIGWTFKNDGDKFSRYSKMENGLRHNTMCHASRPTVNSPLLASLL
jgi:hypothetical protein